MPPTLAVGSAVGTSLGQPALTPAQGLPPAPGLTPGAPLPPAATSGLPPAPVPAGPLGAATPRPVGTAPLVASPAPGATVAGTAAAQATGQATTSAVPRQLRGKVVDKDATSLIVSIGQQGSVTVTPGPDADIRRDNQPASLATILIGDQVTLVLGQENELLRILASSAPPEPEPANPGFTVMWQLLLGVVMMGVVLALDRELRERFLGALLEPSSDYRQGKGRS